MPFISAYGWHRLDFRNVNLKKFDRQSGILGVLELKIVQGGIKAKAAAAAKKGDELNIQESGEEAKGLKGLFAKIKGPHRGTVDRVSIRRALIEPRQSPAQSSCSSVACALYQLEITS